MYSLGALFLFPQVTTMRHRLEDVDVSGVHLVGSPANRRQFALVKNLAGRKPEETDSMKLTRAEFRKRLATQITDADKLEKLSDEKLEAMAKAIGIELTEKQTTEPVHKDDDDPEPVAAGDQAALLKAINASVAKIVEPVVKRIEAIENSSAATAKTALQKRAEILKRTGYEIDVDKITEPEVSALETSHAMVVKAAERAGLTKAFGSPESAEPTGGLPAIQKLVADKVVEVLGRSPINKLEEARVKREIYRSNPSLLTAITKAEREARAAAA